MKILKNIFTVMIASVLMINIACAIDTESQYVIQTQSSEIYREDIKSVNPSLFSAGVEDFLSPDLYTLTTEDDELAGEQIYDMAVDTEDQIYNMAIDTESVSETDQIAMLQASPFTKLQLSFLVADSAFDPDKPVVYLTDKTNKRLYAYNYQTGENAYLSFTYSPESLFYSNSEIYVSLLITGHDPYTSTESGAVAIVDPDTMTLKSQFTVNIDPYDIEVDDDYIYLTSGSSQWTYMRSYSKTTKQEVSNARISQKCLEKMHPILKRLYTITTDLSPRDISVYNISNGALTDYYDSPYHGDYSMARNFEISPDGKYIFNGAGTIFTCDAVKAKDIRYKYTIDSPFTDIVFDLDN